MTVKNLMFFPKTEMRQGYLLSLLSFNTVLEVLARSKRQEKEIKDTENEQEIIKIFIHK